MTAKHKRYNKKSRKSKVVGKRGGDNRYYNEVGDPDRDSVDEKMEKWFTGAPNTDKYDNQNGWLAIGVIGAIGAVLIGVSVIKRR
jgi:ElaB/YqjD/DUF883 family membrane-anchored ribosome-binding protein